MVDFTQRLIGNFQVDARGGDGGVPHETLDGDQIGATLKQTCGEVVAEHVRRELSFGQSGFLAEGIHESLHAPRLKATSMAVDKASLLAPVG